YVRSDDEDRSAVLQPKLPPAFVIAEPRFERKAFSTGKYRPYVGGFSPTNTTPPPSFANCLMVLISTGVNDCVGRKKTMSFTSLGIDVRLPALVLIVDTVYPWPVIADVALLRLPMQAESQSEPCPKSSHTVLPDARAPAAVYDTRLRIRIALLESAVSAAFWNRPMSLNTTRSPPGVGPSET